MNLKNYTSMVPAFISMAKTGKCVVEAGATDFLKIIFDNALQYKDEEVYVTIFDKRPEQLG